ncbi:MAG: energy-coupling factor ABC transporter ATP-binding protein [Chloroflexi bacterium]|nr:energy-coupling factor ABC transporter ATP-binding protein [Chloroflexota bacterium]
MEYSLVVEDLSFRYRSRQEPAIQQVSFRLRPGELMLVAGASGCGKTTLARCINGLIPRSYKGERSGAVLIQGQDAARLPLAQIAQQVGTLLQDPERQIVASKVSAEVAFGLENLGLPPAEIRQRVTAALARLNIESLHERDTFALSGGEKQKVALAGVLAMRPAILLLDEPLASLDPASAYEALLAFRSLADEGTTIVMIEHRVEDALQARPDCLLYMVDGQVKYLGAVDELPVEVDHRAVKLPAPWIVRRVQQVGAEATPPPPPPAQTASNPLVEFTHVSFAYDEGKTILYDINLKIYRGDLIALLGPNGAGKSTLVKHAIGLLKPKQGQVLLDGEDTRKTTVAQNARKIGYVFQSPAHMLFAPTVGEELAFGPNNLGFSKEQTADSVSAGLAAVNLSGAEGYPPLGLSFGQQKRVTIAAVLAMRSRIMVLDEPTAGQDYANYTRFMEFLCGRGGEKGRSLLSANFDATLFITHDLDLAVTFANRVLLVSEGRLAADGPPQEVLLDDDLLARCRMRPTSLLRLNRQLLPQSGKFLPAEALAAYT